MKEKECIMGSPQQAMEGSGSPDPSGTRYLESFKPMIVDSVHLEVAFMGETFRHSSE